MKPTMDRRDFLKTTAAGGVLAMVTSVETMGQPAAGPGADRNAWIGILRKLADPVVTHLANGTLKARMPVEQAAGADRRAVTHLEALGRLAAGIAPWLELAAGPGGATAEGRLGTQYADRTLQA